MKMKFLPLILCFAWAGITGAVAQTNVTSNSGMETWDDATYSLVFTVDFPTQWMGSDAIMGENYLLMVAAGLTPQNHIFESSDAHGGASAASIRTVAYDSIGALPGALTNAKLALDITQVDPEDLTNIMSALSISGGTAVGGNMKVDSVVAWIKAPATNEDNGSVTISAVRRMPGADTNTILGSGYVSVAPSADGYQRVSVPMTYLDAQNTATDTLIVIFASSETGVDSFHAGNEIIVDDVTMFVSQGTLSIELPLLNGDAMSVFPVPANDGVVNFKLNSVLKASEFSLMITDISGREVYQSDLKDPMTSIDFSQFANGTYMYSVTHRPSQQKESGKLVISRK